jgi:hypothetical protein
MRKLAAAIRSGTRPTRRRGDVPPFVRVLRRGRVPRSLPFAITPSSSTAQPLPSALATPKLAWSV